MAEYADLPYTYVIKAVKNLLVLKKRALYTYELPIANIAAMQANFKRDPRKNSKPYSYKDFTFYSDSRDGSGPAARYGSAAIALVIAGKFPTWALFCFQDLKKSAVEGVKPDRLALIAEDALLLAPIRTEYGYIGFLIAMESASGKKRAFIDDKGETVYLTVPPVETKIVAREDAELF